MRTLRILGIGVLFSFLAVAAFDGTHTAKFWDVVTARLTELWTFVYPGSLAFVRTGIAHHLPSLGWDQSLRWALALAALLGIVLIGIARACGAAGQRQGLRCRD